MRNVALNNASLVGTPARGLGTTNEPRAANDVRRAPLDVSALGATPRAGMATTQQAFQATARAASMMGGVAAPDGGSFNPLAANGTAQAQGFLDDLLGGLGGFGEEALASLGGGGGYFEDRVAALMINVVEDMQKKVEQRLQKLQSEAQAAEAQAAAGGQDTGGESRNIEFEKIKFDMQKLSQMQQAMSNVLNTMDELAKSAIRQIKV